MISAEPLSGASAENSTFFSVSASASQSTSTKPDTYPGFVSAVTGTRMSPVSSTVISVFAADIVNASSGASPVSVIMPECSDVDTGFTSLSSIFALSSRIT